MEALTDTVEDESGALKKTEDTDLEIDGHWCW